MKVMTVPSINVAIFIAGDLDQAKQTCREWCMEVGACVTVEPVSYIYTGGEEIGVSVGFINYPRFPSDESAIMVRARELADRLLHKLCQHSYSIVGPTDTEWHSRRPQTASPHSPLQDRDGEERSENAGRALLDALKEEGEAK